MALDTVNGPFEGDSIRVASGTEFPRTLVDSNDNSEFIAMMVTDRISDYEAEIVLSVGEAHALIDVLNKHIREIVQHYAEASRNAI